MDAEQRRGHSPGPWTTTARPECYNEYEIKDAGGHAFAYLKGTFEAPDPDEFRRVSNARLIAAAPELLAACQAAALYTTGRDDCDELYSILMDVIEKAYFG